MTLFDYLGIDYIDNEEEECNHDFDYFSEEKDYNGRRYIISYCKYCDAEDIQDVPE